MKEMQQIRSIIQASIDAKAKMLSNQTLLNVLEASVDTVSNCLASGGKVLLCGNGGSAADAQHLAAELAGRFYLDRPPLFVEALHVNTSSLTAVSNDYGYKESFRRLVQAKGKKNDVLIGLSTSGNSPNVVLAMQAAKELGMHTIGLTGAKAAKMDTLSDHLLKAEATDTARIQECHILLGHILCQLVEARLFGDKA
ncbi:MAG: D-sedoheptulose 7-phosphate isomerase [Bacteroidota bacterium]